MIKGTALLLGRYEIRNDGQSVSAVEQVLLFDRLLGAQPISYRKSEPGPEDYDTYIIRPVGKRILDQPCITLDVLRDVRFRQVLKADRSRQTVTAEFQATEEVELAHVVAMPDLGVFAVEDRSGDGRFPGW